MQRWGSSLFGLSSCVVFNGLEINWSVLTGIKWRAKFLDTLYHDMCFVYNCSAVWDVGSWAGFAKRVFCLHRIHCSINAVFTMSILYRQNTPKSFHGNKTRNSVLTKLLEFKQWTRNNAFCPSRILTFYECEQATCWFSKCNRPLKRDSVWNLNFIGFVNARLP